MCGLFGWNWHKSPRKTTIRTLAALLVVGNDRRGGDSWGWYGPGSGQLRRGLGRAENMNGAIFAAMVGEPAVIGHTRRATTGAVALRNCHPFDVGNVVGAHNGMVFNHLALNTRYARACEVDSEHLFWHLSEDLPLSDIEAYGAVTFHHRERNDGSLFFGTFHDGELAVARVPGHGTVWSSDWSHLETAVRLSGLTADIDTVEDGVIYGCGSDGVWECGDLDVAPPRWVTGADRKRTGTAAADDESLWDVLDDDDGGRW